MLSSIIATPSKSVLLLTGSMSVAALFVTTVAVALPTASVSKPLSQTLTGDARAAYESAKLLFEDGDHAGALTKFKRAFELSSDPRLLWNMAVCEKELRHYARSAALVNRYLEDGSKVISAEQRRSATETQTALRAFYSTVQLDGAADGATVLVDGEPVGKIPLSEPLLLDLGIHQLRVELSDYIPFEKSIDVPGGERLQVPIVLTHAPVGQNESLPRLSVTSSGERDIIAIDGKVMGSRHWEGVVAVGEHSVRVTAPHKKTYQSQLQLVSGSSRTLQINLEDEARGSTVWYWVAGGATVVAGAVVGGYFLFRSKDEPGAHPTGALTTIFLPGSSPAAATGAGSR